MARSIPATLQAEFDKTVTRVGYLVELSTAPPLRWCDLSTLAWDGKTFVTYDLTVKGISGAGISRGGTLEVQNLDDAAAAALVNGDMSSVTCSIWAVAPSAMDDTGPGGSLSALLLEDSTGLMFEDEDYLILESSAPSPVVKLGEFGIGSMEIALDKLTLQLVSSNYIESFSPRRRVDVGNGFAYALPEGTQIAWENEVYVVGADRA